MASLTRKVLWWCVPAALVVAGVVWAWQEGLLEPSDPKADAPTITAHGLDPKDTKFVPKRLEAPAELREGWSRVVRVVDGDTVRVLFEGKEEPLRLIGVDAPELMNEGKGNLRNQPGGFEAAAWLEAKLAGDPQVRLEFDTDLRDRYGRLLAYAWIPNDLMLNEELVRLGHAKPVYYKPNGKYRARLEAAAK